MIHTIPWVNMFVQRHQNEIVSLMTHAPVAVEVAIIAKGCLDVLTSDADLSTKKRHLFYSSAQLGLTLVAVQLNATIPIAVFVGALGLAIKTYKNPQWVSDALNSHWNYISDTSSAWKSVRTACIAIAAIPTLYFAARIGSLITKGRLVQHIGNYAYFNYGLLRQINHPVIVYGAHIGLGAIALQKTITAYKQKKFAKATFNGVTSFVATSSQFVYEALSTQRRWHHLSYGLISMLTPYRALHIFGSIMTLDGASYLFKSSRIDCSHLVARNTGRILGATALGVSLQILTEALEPSSEFFSLSYD